MLAWRDGEKIGVEIQRSGSTNEVENRFRFGIDHANEVRLNIETGVLDCWKRGASTRIVTRLAAQVGPHEVRNTLELADEMPGLAESVHDALGHRTDIGAVRERSSRTIEGSYVSNGCARRGALIARFFEHDAWSCEEEIVGEIEWQLDAGAKNLLGQETQRWGVWTTQRTVRC